MSRRNKFTARNGKNIGEVLQSERIQLIPQPSFVTREYISNNTPSIISFYKNYPNPFNESTTLSYSLTQPGLINISIYNSIGQIQCTLVNDRKAEGIHSINWNAQHFPSGLYYIQLKTGTQTCSLKAVLIK